MSATPPRTVKETGAGANDVLVGITPRNMGLVIRVDFDQPAGHGGRIQGSFDLVHWGTGPYSTQVEALYFSKNRFGSVEEFIDSLTGESPHTEFTHGLKANGLWRLDAEAIAGEIINGAEDA